MLTNFDGMDFQRPIDLCKSVLKGHSEESLHAEIGEVARDNADDEFEPNVTVGFQLRRQYEGMNDEQRQGFNAALIALTGLSYESIVKDAITRLGAVLPDRGQGDD